MGKYYWLKLGRDFFKRHDVRILEAMPDGTEILLFYMKLMCESVDHNGRLRFSEDIPYTPKMLSVATGTDPEMTENAIDTLIQFGLMDQEPDGTYVLPKVQKMIDSASDTDGARRVREFRERQKTEALQNVTDCNVTPCTKCNESKKKSKSIEIDIEDKGEKIPVEQIVNLYSEICTRLPKIVKVTETRRTAIKARWAEYHDIEVFRRLFTMANESEFLTGNNDRKWTADIDFLMTQSKMARVLEGKYNNTQTKQSKEGKSFTTAEFYNAAVGKAYKSS